MVMPSSLRSDRLRHGTGAIPAGTLRAPPARCRSSGNSGAAGRQAIPARWTRRAVPAQAAQQGIDRALARDHPVRFGETADEIEPVTLLIREQREHAVLERAPPHLRKKGVLLGYHVLQGTWDYLTSQRG